MTPDTMLAVVAELGKRGVGCSFEHPGVIHVSVPSTGTLIIFGDANETINGDVYEVPIENDPSEVLDTGIPSDSDDVMRIADAIASFYTKACEAYGFCPLPERGGQEYPPVHVKAEDADNYKCPCGNTVNATGFFPCDPEGNEIEPEPGAWGRGLYVCPVCKRMHEVLEPEPIKREKPWHGLGECYTGEELDPHDAAGGPGALEKAIAEKLESPNKLLDALKVAEAFIEQELEQRVSSGLPPDEHYIFSARNALAAVTDAIDAARTPETITFGRIHRHGIYTDYEAEVQDRTLRLTLVDGGKPYLVLYDGDIITS